MTETTQLTLEQRVERLEDAIFSIAKGIEEIRSTQHRIHTHITFVEGVYETVKFPLHVIRNQIEYFAKMLEGKQQNSRRISSIIEDEFEYECDLD